ESVASSIKVKQKYAETFPSVTVLFCQVDGIKQLVSGAEDLVVMLNKIFTKFDEISDLHPVYKIETINDIYMVSCGVPQANEKHARAMCNFALALQRACKDMVDAGEIDQS